MEYGDFFFWYTKNNFVSLLVLVLSFHFCITRKYYFDIFKVMASIQRNGIKRIPIKAG